MRVIGDKNQVSEDVFDFMISYLPFTQKSIRSEPAKLFSIIILGKAENVFQKSFFPRAIKSLDSIVKVMLAEPQSSVGSIADLRTGGCWFDARLCQYSFQGLMIVIATSFIPLSPMSIVLMMVMWESNQWLGKKYCTNYWL